MIQYSGMTYFHGQSSYYIAEASTSYRQLLRFDKLKDFFPPDAQVIEAELLLTFINYNALSNLDLCFITKPWDYTNVKR